MWVGVLIKCDTVIWLFFDVSGGMSLLRYLKQKDGLPDPKASLTSKVPTGAIVRANRKVEAEMVEQKKKRGPYRR